MNETELRNRPLFYEKDGYIGISKIDGTPILLPNRYVSKRNPYCCPDFSDGVAPVSLPDGASGYIDEQGEVALPFIYEYAYPFIDGYAVVKSQGKWGMIDRDGHVTVPFAYDQIPLSGFCADDRYGVVKNGKFGYVTLDGTEAIPCRFDIPFGKCDSEFREGVAPVSLHGRVFFINPAGEEVITPRDQFDYVGNFMQGYAVVNRFNHDDHHIYLGFLDRNGSLVVPVQYQWISSDLSSWADGVLAVRFKGETVYIDRAGCIVLKAPYDLVTGFYGGVAWGQKNGGWESFDRKGNVLATNVRFEGASYCGEGRWLARSGEEWRCVDAYGHELLGPGVVPPSPYLNLDWRDWTLYWLRENKS